MDGRRPRLRRIAAGRGVYLAVGRPLMVKVSAMVRRSRSPLRAQSTLGPARCGPSAIWQPDWPPADRPARRAPEWWVRSAFVGYIPSAGFPWSRAMPSARWGRLPRHTRPPRRACRPISRAWRPRIHDTGRCETRAADRCVADRSAYVEGGRAVRARGKAAKSGRGGRISLLPRPPAHRPQAR